MEQNVKENGSAPRGVAVERVAGYVKWYDAAKGFGFIVPDAGGADVFLGKAVVEMAGFGLPSEGCRVEAMAQIRDKGRSATALLSVGPPDPATLETLRAARRPRPATPMGPRPADVTGPRRGVVKLFNVPRGFGFITIGDGTADIFFHVTTGSNLRALAVGDEVDVVWGAGPNGLTAVEVTPAEEPAEMRRSA
jgi:CspA family cold shock protein